MEAFIGRLEELGVAVVAFDMDQTAVNQHSMGRMRKDCVGEFVSNASRDFVEVVPELLERGFKVAIATHSDTIEYNNEITKEDHLLGDDLVGHLLNSLFPPLIVDEFFVVAYNTSRRKDYANPGKTHHMKLISRHYGVPLSSAILFDDDIRNIISTSPIVKCCHTNPDCGFKYTDLTL